MEIKNEKVTWIEGLFITRQALAESKGTRASLTFLTNFGFIVAEEAELVNADADSLDDLKNKTILHLNEKKSIDPVSVTSAIVNLIKKQHDEVQYEDVGKMICVQNACIYNYNNMSFKVPVSEMVINVDQIVGVIPGELEIKTD